MLYLFTETTTILNYFIVITNNLREKIMFFLDAIFLNVYGWNGFLFFQIINDFSLILDQFQRPFIPVVQIDYQWFFQSFLQITGNDCEIQGIWKFKIQIAFCHLLLLIITIVINNNNVNVWKILQVCVNYHHHHYYRKLKNKDRLNHQFLCKFSPCYSN